MVYVYIRPHTSHTYIYIRPRRTPHVFLLVQRYRAAGAICGPVFVPFRKQSTHAVFSESSLRGGANRGFSNYNYTDPNRPQAGGCFWAMTDRQR